MATNSPDYIKTGFAGRFPVKLCCQAGNEFSTGNGTVCGASV
jgi:hypothetical protein